MRTARNAAVAAEINQLAQALAAFKTKYGDLSAEPGLPGGGRQLQPERPHHRPDHHRRPGDITYRQLAQPVARGPPEVLPPGRPSAPRGSSGRTRQRLVRLQRQRRQFDAEPLHPPRPRVPGLLPGRHPASPTATGFGDDRASARTRPTRSRNSIVGQLHVQRQPPAAASSSSPPTGSFPTPTGSIPRLIRRRWNRQASPATTTRSGNSTLGRYGLAQLLRLLQRLRQRQLRPQRRELRRRPTHRAAGRSSLHFTVIGLAFHVASPGRGLAVSPAPNPYTSTLTIRPRRGGHDVPESPDVPDHLVGDRRPLRRRRPVRPPTAPGDAALPVDLDAQPVQHDATPAIRVRERDNVTNFHNGKLE